MLILCFQKSLTDILYFIRSLNELRMFEFIQITDVSEDVQNVSTSS